MTKGINHLVKNWISNLPLLSAQKLLCLTHLYLTCLYWTVLRLLKLLPALFVNQASTCYLSHLFSIRLVRLTIAYFSRQIAPCPSTQLTIGKSETQTFCIARGTLQQLYPLSLFMSLLPWIVFQYLHDKWKGKKIVIVASVGKRYVAITLQWASDCICDELKTFSGWNIGKMYKETRTHEELEMSSVFVTSTDKSALCTRFTIFYLL